jgi:hypothetical protein
VPEPQAIPYRGGVRLALLRDTRGTYAVTAGMVGSAICVRVGAAVPAGAAPVQAASRCVDDVNRQLWLSSTLRVAGLQAAFVLVSPDATGLAWQQGGSVVAVELHDLPGSGRKVALLAAPRLADSALVATAGSQTLATLRIGPTPPLAPAEPAPTTTNAVALFGYEGGPRLPMTLWAQHEADGQVRFVGAGDDVPGLVDVFQGVPPGVDRPVREASLDRVAFGERWVCGTARTDVARVAYRLADGRTAPAALHDVPEGGRVWCVRLPHERLDQPPAGGDLIVATLSDGSRYEVTPKY